MLFQTWLGSSSGDKEKEEPRSWYFALSCWLVDHNYDDHNMMFIFFIGRYFYCLSLGITGPAIVTAFL